VRFAVDAAAGQPLYLQLIQQIRHAIETGVLQPGDPLPALRVLAQELVMSPNTVVKAYDELHRDGWIEIRHGSGAYVSARRGMRPRADRLRAAQERVRATVARLHADGISDAEIERLFAAELRGVPAGARNTP
jgi:GntR family transcriptional regulator